MPHTLKHVLPETAPVNENTHLEIGGVDTVELAERFGTPLFVFCEETFRRRARGFKEAFPESPIYYAAKAFTCLGMCKLVQEEGLHMDVASAGELHTALVAGFPPERLILHGNNKTHQEISRAVEAGVGRIAIDNFEEISRVDEIASAAGRRQRVLIRVTPGVEAHTHEYIQTGQEDSKFGVSVEAGLAEKAVDMASEKESLELAGIHAHIGSNIFSFDPFARTVEILFEFLAKIAEKFAAQPIEVNLGGGIGIPYLSGDYPARLELMAELLGETVEREAAGHGLSIPRLAFEPGRFLVGNAMVTLYRVGTIKEVPGIRTYVSVDGGMSDNIRPALYQARYSALVANKPTHEPTRLVTVAGMHCESGDVLIRDIPLPETLASGDLLAVPATGAYGYSMASNYNRKPRPAVISVKSGDATTMVRAETLDDLVRLDQS